MKMNNTKYSVDFKGVHYYSEIHKALRKGLGLPGYYGENLDALWDCMREIIDNDVVIILKNYQAVEQIDKDYAEKILYVFCEAKHFADDYYIGSHIIVERDGVMSELE